MVAGTLVACGSESGPGTTAAGGTAQAAQAPKKGEATAEEVADEMRGDLDCPAKVKTAKPAADAGVVDVVGVRPGLTYEEAANLVMCTHDLLVVTADGRGFQLPANGKDIRQGFSARFAEPRVVKSSEDYMREMSEEMMARSGNAVRQDMKPGQSKWYVGTIGMPGQERVISAAREEWFEEGRSPTVASVEQALIKKYGEPTRSQHWDAGSVALTWATIRWAGASARLRRSTTAAPVSPLPTAAQTFHLTAASSWRPASIRWRRTASSAR
jgi:hypothetical protein